MFTVHTFLPHMKFIFVKASALGANVTVCLLYTLLYILFASDRRNHKS